ncbi:MAG TPA: hypothetical protein PLA68_17825, partial [Panacibacter sp.]|nr:hypothetical protein [Panacibacter sp.]
MKKSVLLIAACFTFYVTCFSQTTDSVLSESRTTGEWQKNSLDIYTRDASCALVSALTLTWDAGTQSWVNAFLSAYSNGTGGVSEVFTQNWDAINNEWVNNSKSLFFPGNGGSKKRYILQTWDASSGTWINSYRIIEDLDGLGRTVTSEFDLYSNNEWQKIQRSLLSYDAENRVAQSIFQVWANNEWLNNGKTTNSYTSKGITYDYLWDNTNSVWTIFRRAYNDYIDNTALSTKLFGQIIAGTDWMNAFRSTSSYNSDNRLLSNLQQFWDANTLQWVNGGRIKSDYYENGSQHHFRFESWDASTSSWSYGFRTTGTDMSCLQSLQLLPVSAVNNRTVLLSQNNDGKNLLHRMPEAKAPSYKSFQRIFNPLAGDSKNVVYDI